MANPEIEKQIGARIRLARLVAGLTQTELARVCGNLTFRQFQKYENGSNRVSVSRLLEIAKATGQPISFFMPEEATLAVADNGASFKALDLDIATAARRLPPKARAALRDLIENIVPIA